jgi:diguanylate cyclase (GGDEF)-like protein
VFLTIVSVGTSAVLFAIVALAFYFGSTRIVDRQAEIAARGISDEVKRSLLLVMESGATGDEITQVAAAMQAERNEGDGFHVEVFRGLGTATPGDHGKDEKTGAMLDSVRTTGNVAVSRDGDRVDFYFPLGATQRCLSCHTTARQGDLLGVVHVGRDAGPSLREARLSLLLLLLLLFPLPVLGTFLFARVLSRRLDRSVEAIRACTQSVNETSDLDTVTLDTVNLGFVEFDAVLAEVNRLTETLKAASKDLKQQVGFHEALMISADSIRDWQVESARMLGILRDVAPIRALLVAFVQPDTQRELVVFWAGEPTTPARERTAQAMLNLLAWNASAVDGSENMVTHVVAVPGVRLGHPDDDELPETLVHHILNVTGVGGIVGAAFVLDTAEEPPSQALRGSLITTLNVVGALRAIDTYARQIEYHATRDALTDLPNQKMFWELLDYEVARARRHDYKFCVLVLDFDGFKLVNDTHGHAVGDTLLREAASVLRGSMRAGDLLARYGGDEFVVIAPECGTEQGHTVARRLLDDLAAFAIPAPDGSPLRIAASIGLACFPDHGTGPKDLFRMADVMMYRAKSHGKGRISSPTAADASDKAASAGESGRIVQQALAEGLFVPYYQPIVDVESGAIMGHEVLLRIVLPDRVVAAGEVIETIEAMGVINQVDLVVFEKAFQRVHDAAYDGLLFLNFSPKVLIDLEYMAHVRALLDRFRIPPGRIVFEITERQTVRNISLLETFARDLVRDGFGLAIDDFGTGFSSYEYLRRLPVSTLKIDGQFVQGMGRPDGMDRAVLMSISALARQLGIRCVAECVEDAKALAGVAECGISYAQGYHLGRPGPDLRTSPARPPNA